MLLHRLQFHHGLNQEERSDLTLIVWDRVRISLFKFFLGSKDVISILEPGQNVTAIVLPLGDIVVESD